MEYDYITEFIKRPVHILVINYTINKTNRNIQYCGNCC